MFDGQCRSLKRFQAARVKYEMPCDLLGALVVNWIETGCQAKPFQWGDNFMSNYFTDWGILRRKAANSLRKEGESLDRLRTVDSLFIRFEYSTGVLIFIGLSDWAKKWTKYLNDASNEEWVFAARYLYLMRAHTLLGGSVAWNLQCPALVHVDQSYADEAIKVEAAPEGIELGGIVLPRNQTWILQYLICSGTVGMQLCSGGMLSPARLVSLDLLPASISWSYDSLSHK